VTDGPVGCVQHLHIALLWITTFGRRRLAWAGWVVVEEDDEDVFVNLDGVLRRLLPRNIGLFTFALRRRGLCQGLAVPAANFCTVLVYKKATVGPAPVDCFARAGSVRILLSRLHGNFLQHQKVVESMYIVPFKYYSRGDLA
jgi:hypothetical protein